MSLIQFALSVHLLCVGLGLGISFSNLVGFRVAKGLGGEKAMGIAAHRESLIPYGDTFFFLIILSGVTMLWAIGGPSGLKFWFQFKMVAVAVWIVVYVLMRLRIRKFLATRDMSLVALIRTYAHVVITAVTLAVIFAVLTFAA